MKAWHRRLKDAVKSNDLSQVNVEDLKKLLHQYDNHRYVPRDRAPKVALASV